MTSLVRALARAPRSLAVWLCLVFACLFSPGAALAQADCFAASIPDVTINYTGATTVEVMANITVTRVNTDNSACPLPPFGDFRLELTRNGPGGVDEWSTNVNGVTVLAYEPGSFQILTPRTYVYDGHWFWATLSWTGNTAQIPVRFRVPSGQTAQAGTARLQVARQIGTDWRRKGASSTLSITVPPTLELSISGLTTGTGATTGTVDFGTATGAAQTRALSIRALATTGYTISVESAQSGVMRRTTSCATTQAATSDAAEQIAYGLTINGSTVTPAAMGGTIGSANRFSSSSNTNSAPNSRVILPVNITVPAFDLTQRRAGQFCDVVRMRINAQ